MQPQQSSQPYVNPYEGAAAREHQLSMHREHSSALSTNEAMVARAATGEQVEIDPLRRMSVYEIYNHILRNFKKKDESARQAALMKTQADLGVMVDTTLPEATVDDAPDRSADADTAEKKLMHQLAEDIYDALERVHKTIAIIKPASIGAETISKLRHPADANFLVETGEGQRLYTSLQEQDADFRVVKKK